MNGLNLQSFGSGFNFQNAEVERAPSPATIRRREAEEEEFRQQSSVAAARNVPNGEVARQVPPPNGPQNS